MTEPTRLFQNGIIRGEANVDFTPELVQKIGIAAGAISKNGGPHRVIVGKDTSRPNYAIETTLVGALSATGMEVLMLGPIPTPAVAYLTESMRCELGVMISAPGDPYDIAGIRLYGPEGTPLSEEFLKKIEEMMRADVSKYLTKAESIRTVRRIEDAQGGYVEHVKHMIPKGLNLEGVRVIVDCANGACYKVIPKVLQDLGAEVFALNVEPDGFNINHNCGVKDFKLLSKEVLLRRGDIGMAFDGGGETVIMSDENGVEIGEHRMLAHRKDDDKIDDPFILAIRTLAAIKEAGFKPRWYQNKS